MISACSTRSAASRRSRLRDYSASWDQAATTLDLTLDDLLAYGDANNTVTYEVTIGTGAQDAEGTPLSQEVVFSFATLRRLALTVALGTPSGMYRYNEMVVGSNLYIGDETNNDSERAFLTFDLSGLPADAAVGQTSLVSYQESVAGTPYTDLDTAGRTLEVYEQPFSAVGVLAGAANLVGNLCADEALGECGRDVTAEVRSAFDDGRPAQFMVRFAVFSDGDGSYDRVKLTRNMTRLELNYIAP